MPLKPNPLRILVLASIYGYSVQGMAADATWKCTADPVTGQWACQQSGEIAQARAALTMARKAAGKAPLSEEQIEQMLQPPEVTARPVLAHPVVTQTTPDAAAEAMAETAETTGLSDTKSTATTTEPPSAETMDRPASAAVVTTTAIAPSPAATPTPVNSGNSGFITRNTNPDTPFDTATKTQVVAVERNTPASEAPSQATTPVAEQTVAFPQPIPEPDTVAPVAEAPSLKDDLPEDVPVLAADQKAHSSGESSTPAAPPASSAPIAYEKPVQEGAWDQIDLLGMDIASTLEKDKQTRAQTTKMPNPLSALRELAESHVVDVVSSEPEEAIDIEIASPPAHYDGFNAIPFLPSIAQSKFFSACGAQADHGLTHDIPAYRPKNAESLPTYGEADSIQGRPGELMSLIGNAVLQRADQTIRSNTIHYNRKLERADFSENVEIRETGMAMNSSHGHYIMAKNDGEFGASQIYLPQKHIRISSDSVSINARDLITTQNTTYTTCNYGDDFWMLDAEEVELDRTTGTGVAWNAWGKIEGVPVFYTPYITFPIDDRRKTGFLLPSYGSSDDNGTMWDIPFYWNIAPNYDATFNLRYMEERGILLENEFRYLHDSNRGTFNANFIESDDIYDDERGYFSLEHQQRLTPALDFEIDAAHVTDDQFFKDFDSTLYMSSLTNLTRELEIHYLPGPYKVTALFQDNYTIDRTTAPSSRPYRLLPRITASTSHYDVDTGNQYSLLGEFTYFQNSQRLESQRFFLNPRVSHRFSNSWGYITPAADVFATHWLLDDPARTGRPNDTLIVPGLSLDSGIFIDKDFSFQDRNLRHSIEPRLFYVYVPNIEQSDFPNFDSAVTGLTFSNLFRVNRYNGYDRVGDANQITAAVTNRLSDLANPDLNVQLSLGEIFYLEDREVGYSPIENSVLVGELEASLPYNLTITNELQWDHTNAHTDKIEWRVEWTPTDDHYLLYEYKASKNSLRESLIAFRAPVTKHLDFLYKRRHDHFNDHTTRSFWGLEYDSCCWTARFGALKDPFQSTGSASDTTAGTASNFEPETQVYLQFEFKGLVGVGTRVDNLFEDEVKL